MDKSAKKLFERLMTYLKRKSSQKRKLLMSVISFILTFILMSSMSISWFTTKTSELEVNDFQLDCGKGLRVNDTGTSTMSFSTLDDEYLIPASSVDGRNLYFPTDGADFSSTTQNMTFRSANAGDKNHNYIQIDFSLTAQQNHTALYINEEKTSIKVKNSHETEYGVSQAAALRTALWCSTAENGVPNTPIVFNPTASTLYTAAVEDVDRSTGAFISSGRQVAHTFSDYSFGGTPVATLERGIETKFSYIIWLEGTDPKCTDKIIEKDIEIKLAFTTSWDKTETIRFEDASGTVSGLLNETYSLSLHYEDENDSQNANGAYMDFNMYRVSDNVNNIWSCNIPGDMRNKVSFVLRSTDETKYLYIFFKDPHNNETYNREANRKYVVDVINTETGDCSGHWVAIGDSDGAGHDNGGGFEGDDF